MAIQAVIVSFFCHPAYVEAFDGANKPKSEFSYFQDERNEKEKLINELIQKDKEWNRREQTLSLQYKKEVNDLKQKVFVLESRLTDVDEKKQAFKASNLKVGYM